MLATKKSRLILALLLASPVILVTAILLEVAIFGTRHISDAAESLGLDVTEKPIQLSIETLGMQHRRLHERDRAESDPVSGPYHDNQGAREGRKPCARIR